MMPTDPDAVRVLGLVVNDGFRPAWQPGDKAEFRYSFPSGSTYPELEGRDGPVEIVGRAQDDAGDYSMVQRFSEDYEVRVYTIRFADGFEHSAFEDELTTLQEVNV